MSFWKALPWRISTQTSLLWESLTYVRNDKRCHSDDRKEEESLLKWIWRRGFLVGLTPLLGITWLSFWTERSEVKNLHLMASGDSSYSLGMTIIWDSSHLAYRPRLGMTKEKAFPYSQWEIQWNNSPTQRRNRQGYYLSIRISSFTNLNTESRCNTITIHTCRTANNKGIASLPPFHRHIAT